MGCIATFASSPVSASSSDKNPATLDETIRWLKSKMLNDCRSTRGSRGSQFRGSYSEFEYTEVTLAGTMLVFTYRSNHDDEEIVLRRFEIPLGRIAVREWGGDQLLIEVSSGERSISVTTSHEPGHPKGKYGDSDDGMVTATSCMISAIPSGELQKRMLTALNHAIRLVRESAPKNNEPF
jgi:hypothetical protein